MKSRLSDILSFHERKIVCVCVCVCVSVCVCMPVCEREGDSIR